LCDFVRLLPQLRTRKSPGGVAIAYENLFSHNFGLLERNGRR
jgi:hypothetical protein